MLIFPTYNWNLHIFSILFLVLVLFVQKYIDFSHKLGIRRIESKKYNNCRHKSGRLEIQIKDDYYINWKKPWIRKFFNNFPKIWIEKAVGGWVSLLRNEGETDSRKAKIVVSFDDFSAPSGNIECLFFGFFINVPHNSIFTLLTVN